MIEIGRVQTLKVQNIVEFGVYLDAGTENRNDNVLLPKEFVPENTELEDEIEVFIYKDSEDRIIATTQMPIAQVGELAYLEVVDKAPFGAFLNIGLGRDVLLPHREQKYDIKVGKKYLVLLYLDKTERLCATTRIFDVLESNGEYEKNQTVTGVAYGMKEGMGVLIAVDQKYKGLIPENEVAADLDIDLDNKTMGPVVDQNLLTSRNGVYSCGNALIVSDLVDYVSENGERAGASAAEYALSCNGQKKLIPLVLEGDLLYAVPQFLDINKKNKAIIYFKSIDFFLAFYIGICMLIYYEHTEQE